jgi:hypothetical protein
MIALDDMPTPGSDNAIGILYEDDEPWILNTVGAGRSLAIDKRVVSRDFDRVRERTS